jgi:hypothetical protein
LISSLWVSAGSVVFDAIRLHIMGDAELFAFVNAGEVEQCSCVGTTGKQQLKAGTGVILWSDFGAAIWPILRVCGDHLPSWLVVILIA